MTMTTVPNAHEFAEFLSQEPRWYVLSSFLGVPDEKLKLVESNYRTDGVMRCLLEVYHFLKQADKEENYSWSNIADVLKRMDRADLANQIISKHSKKDLIQESPELSPCTTAKGDQKKVKISEINVMLPRQQLGIQATMTIIVSNLVSDTSVTATLMPFNALSGEKQCRVSKENDSARLIFVTPEQVGLNILNIMVDGNPVKNSPFEITVVPPRDYTKLTKANCIKNLNFPRFLVHSDDGNLYITSRALNCLQKFDAKTANFKENLGEEGAGKLQFQKPYGIDIKDKILYVCEKQGHRIHKLKTNGEFIETFGGVECEEAGHFHYPFDVKVSPENKIYVADTDNHRVQVFNPDWTHSHTIDGCVYNLSLPEGIAFDLSGNVHITWWGTSRVSVHTPKGELFREIGDIKGLSGPVGIAIDAFGYSLVINYNSGLLLIYDTKGKLVHSIGGFHRPYGFALSPDGNDVWVADRKVDCITRYTINQ